jgi:hypothetical protein
MNPEQMGVYEQVEHDLRMALKSLSEPYMNEVPCIREICELVRAAHDMAESVLLERPLSTEQLDQAIDNILQKITQRSR